MKNEHGLTSQQEKFAVSLAGGMSQADAYRASYKVGRMSDKHVRDEASKLARNPVVSRRVLTLQGEIADRSVLNAADVLTATRRILLSSPKRLVRVTADKDGKERAVFMLPHELDEDTAAAISAVKVDDLGRIEYKFWDKNAAASLAARILGMLEKDNAQRGDSAAQALWAMIKGGGGSVVKPAHDAAGPEA